MTEFYKYNVRGNNFVLVERPSAITRWGIRKLCCGRRGIGADQYVEASRSVEHRDQIDVAIYNPDGSRSSFCGNALLSTGFHFLRHDRGRNGLTLVCGEKRVRLTMLGDAVELAMPAPVIESAFAGGRLLGDSLSEFLIRCGTHHYVVVVPDPSSFAVAQDGPRIERSAVPDRTVNVMFVQQLGRGALRMSPWERCGSGATLSCGSGATSAVHAVRTLTADDRDCTRWAVECPGGTLAVKVDQDELWLESLPELVFSGFFAKQYFGDGEDD